MAAVGLTPLQVRRGSEPALNHLPPPTSASPSNLDPTKRWSAAPLIEDEPTPKSAVARKAQHRKDGGQRQRRSSESGQLSPTWGEEDEGSGRDSGRGSSAFSKFVRDSNRLSMQFLGDGSGGKWLEAAERAASEMQKVPTAPRKEPLGANSSSPVQQHRKSESDADEDEL
jgi:partitioning defective protein 3